MLQRLSSIFRRVPGSRRQYLIDLFDKRAFAESLDDEIDAFSVGIDALTQTRAGLIVELAGLTNYRPRTPLASSLKRALSRATDKLSGPLLSVGRADGQNFKGATAGDQPVDATRAG